MLTMIQWEKSEVTYDKENNDLLCTPFPFFGFNIPAMQRTAVCCWVSSLCQAEKEWSCYDTQFSCILVLKYSFPFSSFRYRTMVLLFHQWLSEFQCGIYFGTACATTDLSHGESASEISWWVRGGYERQEGGFAKEQLFLLEVKLGSGKVYGMRAKFLELITWFSIDPTMELLCRKKRQWDAVYKRAGMCFSCLRMIPVFSVFTSRIILCCQC